MAHSISAPLVRWLTRYGLPLVLLSLLGCGSDDDGGPDDNGGAKECAGLARRCSTLTAGSCGSQDGCTFSSHVRWNGDLEFECDGWAKTCSAYTSKVDCLNQSGCSWE